MGDNYQDEDPPPESSPMADDYADNADTPPPLDPGSPPTFQSNEPSSSGFSLNLPKPVPALPKPVPASASRTNPPVWQNQSDGNLNPVCFENPSQFNREPNFDRDKGFNRDLSLDRGYDGRPLSPRFEGERDFEDQRQFGGRSEIQGFSQRDAYYNKDDREQRMRNRDEWNFGGGDERRERSQSPGRYGHPEQFQFSGLPKPIDGRQYDNDSPAEDLFPEPPMPVPAPTSADMQIGPKKLTSDDLARLPTAMSLQDKIGHHLDSVTEDIQESWAKQDEDIIRGKVKGKLIGGKGLISTKSTEGNLKMKTLVLVGLLFMFSFFLLDDEFQINKTTSFLDVPNKKQGGLQLRNVETLLEKKSEDKVDKAEKEKKGDHMASDFVSFLDKIIDTLKKPGSQNDPDSGRNILISILLFCPKIQFIL